MNQISSGALLEPHIPAPHGHAEPHPVEEHPTGPGPRAAGPCGHLRILVVDGAADGTDPLVERLRRQGHEPVCAQKGAAALRVHEDVDLVLLDLDLPDLDGLEVCRVIRSTSRVPVIIVTSRGSELDCVLGLQAGADDYVVRPYGFRELMARIEAVMRRSQWQPATATTAVEHGPLRIDVNSREVTLAGDEVRLTRKEFDLLLLLASHPETVVSRKRLLQQVWGDSWSRRTVDTHVSSLRGKLGANSWIITIRGVGFKIGHP
ncbi:response regulator transcription factor [Streptomyces sp. NPDC060028]|uniref:response regulator transcription factor n=1 Tax=Streptomyces sp. NPDC060028 TaxID=3347041 RepID=UPI0036BEF7EB